MRRGRGRQFCACGAWFGSTAARSTRTLALMERRHTLAWFVVSLGVVGIIAAATPFVESLKLNPRSGEDLPRVNIADLAPGASHVLRLGGNRGYGNAIVATRDLSGTVHAFWLFMSDWRIGIPTGTAWTVSNWCDDFGAVSQASQPTQIVLTCRDEWFQTPQFAEARSESRWTLTGHNLGTWTTDLPPAKFVVEHDEIVIGKRP